MGAAASDARAESAVSGIQLPTLTLNAEAKVDGQGVFLAQVVSAPPGIELPSLRLMDAPRVGLPQTLTRTNLELLLAQCATPVTVSNWLGADSIRVVRQSRMLGERELKDLLRANLQERVVRERGEVEVHFSRPWSAVSVPDEPLTVRLADLPGGGLPPTLLVRFELLSGQEVVGQSQAVLQVKVWREILVARTGLRRGQPLADSDLARERRDILGLREPLADFDANGDLVQVTENVPAGAPVLQRHLRLQSVMFRGQSAEAVLSEGAMRLVLKVEVLEDGAPGQIIRLRNPASRRELRGKVQNEKTVLVCL